MKKPTKSPIDRDNATDVPTDIDVPVPTIPLETYQFTPQPGIQVKELLEIQTAILLKLVGGTIGIKGGLSQIVLTGDYVDMLSDQAARHFSPITEAA